MVSLNIGNEIKTALAGNPQENRLKYGSPSPLCDRISHFFYKVSFRLIGSKKSLSCYQKWDSDQLKADLKDLNQQLKQKEKQFKKALGVILALQKGAEKIYKVKDYEEFIENKLSDEDYDKFHEALEELNKFQNESTAIRKHIGKLIYCLTDTSISSSSKVKKLEKHHQKFEKIQDKIPFITNDYIKHIINEEKIEKLKNCSLFEFQNLTPDLQQKTIQQYNLKPHIEKIAGPLNFIQRLSDLNEETLKKYSLMDVVIKTDELTYVLLSDQEYKALNLSHILLISKEGLRIVDQRLAAMKEASLLDELPEDPMQIPLGIFCQFSAEEINQLAEELPLSIFSFISDEQIKNLNLKNLTNEQLNILIFHSIKNPDSKKRIAVFSNEQAADLYAKTGTFFVEQNLYSESQLSYLIQHLETSNITHTQYTRFFTWNKKEENQKRFALLSHQQVAEVIDNMNSVTVARDLLSDSQLTYFIQHLDPAKVDKHMYINVFRDKDPKENQRRLDLLSPGQTAAIKSNLADFLAVP